MMASMANTGIGAANNLSNSARSRGNTLADLAIQRGNVNSQARIGNSNAVSSGLNQLEGLGLNFLSSRFGGQQPANGAGVNNTMAMNTIPLYNSNYGIA
jgi:hypothetical protein